VGVKWVDVSLGVQYRSKGDELVVQYHVRAGCVGGGVSGQDPPEGLDGDPSGF
jgi:hypothetical protein